MATEVEAQIAGSVWKIETAVGAATTVAVATAKVPFKVAGAVVDAATDEDDEDD